MKELYHWQLQELSGQFAAHTVFAWLASYLALGPIARGVGLNYALRLPVALTIGTFMGVQAQSWDRQSQTFHEIVSQPAPHGTYLRATIKEHFPVWWASVSADLHSAGYSLPEMNEYDKSTEIQRSHTQFDARIV